MKKIPLMFAATVMVLTLQAETAHADMVAPKKIFRFPSRSEGLLSSRSNLSIQIQQAASSSKPRVLTKQQSKEASFRQNQLSDALKKLKTMQDTTQKYSKKQAQKK